MRYSVTFLLITLIAAIFAYGDVLNGAALIARGVFAVCIFLFLIAFFKESASPSPSVRLIRHN
jgi:uncharacterized membrane protein YtjA (UPF0391 family)